MAVVAEVPGQLASGSCGRNLCLGWRQIWVAGTLVAAAAAAAAADRSVLGSFEVRARACAAAAAAVAGLELEACRTTASNQSVVQLEALTAPIAPARSAVGSGNVGPSVEHHRDHRDHREHRVCIAAASRYEHHPSSNACLT